MSAFEKINAQQKGKGTGTPAWMVGEQLKDMIRMDPRCEDLLDKDLNVKEMSLERAAAMIKAFADSHKTGNFACVTPMQADKILREFYGLPGGEERIATSAAPPRNDREERKIVDLADFL
jgi:hypothetical protein